MSVAYILPSMKPLDESLGFESLAMLRRFQDEIVVSDVKGMTAAIRDAFARSDHEIIRNTADDDDCNLPDSIKAIEVMEADPSIDVMVTGGVKSRRAAPDVTVCVPKGAGYGSTVETVAQYGACGSGLFMRRDAVEKHGLLEYDGRMIDVFVVLKAIASGAKVRFCRLDTYRHHMSLADMAEDEYALFRVEKQALYEFFGIWGVRPRSHEVPPVWDGQFA